MRVGFVGLGKLGLPIALAVEAAGHEVAGWDTNQEVIRYIEQRELPYREAEAVELLSDTALKLMEPEELAAWAEVVFVAVQTPHQPQFEGITPLPSERADFDYTYLRSACASVKEAPLIVVVSTVLPGTLEREVVPLVEPGRLLYNPSFIAMGTTIPDFRNPEFVLIGSDEAWSWPLRFLYATINSAPVFVTTIRTAELTKVLYNTFIGLKIAFANTVMELAHKVGADCDDVIDALSMGSRRIISPAYMRGGMGDGGGCHPRDNIALSWLAQEVQLSYDLFDSIMQCREAQTEWLADQAIFEGGHLTLLGKAYKPETNLTTGSPALLMANILHGHGLEFEHEGELV